MKIQSQTQNRTASFDSTFSAISGLVLTGFFVAAFVLSVFSGPTCLASNGHRPHGVAVAQTHPAR